MGQPFPNIIVDGAGNLLVPGVQSPNFSIASQTGWAIMQNGDAFFFNITAEGTITATTVIAAGGTGGVFVYSGLPALGNLVASVTGVAGTDFKGNAYLAGTTQYLKSGSNFYATTMNGSIATFFASSAAGPYSTLLMAYGGGVGLTAAHSPGVINPVSNRVLQLLAPTAASTDNGASLIMAAGSAGTPANNQFGGLLQTSDNGGDGNVYDTGRLTLSSTTAFNVTGPANYQTWTVAARMYKVHAEFIIQNIAVTSIIIFGYTGPTVTNPNRYQITIMDLAPSSPSVQTLRLNNLSSATLTAGHNFRVTIDGTFNFTGPGTLAFEVGVTAGPDTWTIEDGAEFTIYPCSTT